jgi:hypothetical protein
MVGRSVEISRETCRIQTVDEDRQYSSEERSYPEFQAR